MEPERTEWDTRKRNGLLLRETTATRAKRLDAENPDTTGELLVHLTDDVYRAWKNGHVELQTQTHLIAEAVAAHPNTPPDALLTLLKSEETIQPGVVPGKLRPATLSPLPYVFPSPVYGVCAQGICRNPVAPLLTLEMPDFWRLVDRIAARRLLCEAALPPLIVEQWTQRKEKEVAQAARLHLSFAREISAPHEGTRLLNEFWKTFCAIESGKPDWEHHLRWHIKLVELRLAPLWATGLAASPVRLPALSGFAPLFRRTVAAHLHEIRSGVRRDPSGLPRSRRAFLAAVGQMTEKTTPFVQFAAGLHGAFDVNTLYVLGQSLNWIERLIGALCLPLTDAPFPADPWERSPLLLIRHLARDGNHFVRWAAQTRLANSNFVFTWQYDQ